MIGEGQLLLNEGAIYYVSQVEASQIAYLRGPHGEEVVLPLENTDRQLPDGWVKLDSKVLADRLDRHHTFLMDNPRYNDKTPLRDIIAGTR